MRCKFNTLSFIAGLVTIILAGSSTYIPAGDNIEVATANQSVISHRLWADTVFPIEWKLHEEGVINGDGESPMSPGTALDILNSALETWEDVTISYIKVTSAGFTDNHDGKAGCDLENIITWADKASFEDSMAPARGITTCYVGEKFTLSSTNRTVPCGNGYVTLPEESYPNGSVLLPGTILDMDMVWNSKEAVYPGGENYNYVTSPNTDWNSIDILTTATHEAGHLIGLAHASLAFVLNDEQCDQVTMFPAVDTTSILCQLNRKSLAQDDIAASARGYPGDIFETQTGAILGHVMQSNGDPVEGVRVWAFKTDDTSQPVYETFTFTEYDWEVIGDNPLYKPGDYVLDGLAGGAYYVCVLAWNNSVPTFQMGANAYDYSNPGKYNLTSFNTTQNLSFDTEFYDDVLSLTDDPEFSKAHMFQKVEVIAGENTPNRNIIIGIQKTDFVLVVDRSAALNQPFSLWPPPWKTKLQAIKEACKLFVDFLEVSGGHRLGIVQFESKPGVLLETEPLNMNTAAFAHLAIDGIQVMGERGIYGGIKLGINQLMNLASPNKRQILLLLTGGKHNFPANVELIDMHQPVVDSDINFYSIGFGEEIDDAVLTKMAVDSGGRHVNAEHLTEWALCKYLLSIAASAANDATIFDPSYSLASGETASLEVEITPDDRDLTFVVYWRTNDPERIDVNVMTPGGCRISTKTSGKGYDFRRGDTYRIIRIPLPFKCQDRAAGTGTWTISATHGRERSAKEDVEILVFGSSRTDLFTSTYMSGRRPVVTGRLARDGMVLRGGSMKGEVVRPLAAAVDSKTSDTAAADHQRYEKQESRPVRFVLYDDGTHDDERAKDGIFTGTVPVRDPGMYRVRLMARHKTERHTISREQWTTFYFDGRTIIGDAQRAKRTLIDRY